MTDNKKKYIMYLDVDDTILVWTESSAGFAAPKSTEFIKWALEHFEVRWLTMWCPCGEISRKGAEELSYRFNYTISDEEFQQIYNPKSFTKFKTEGIDFDDPRPWVWIEDGIIGNERLELERRGVYDRFYKTNVTNDVRALQSTWRKLARVFNLPGEPSYPYSVEMNMPFTKLDMDALLDKFRNGRMQNHDANKPDRPAWL